MAPISTTAVMTVATTAAPRTFLATSTAGIASQTAWMIADRREGGALDDGLHHQEPPGHRDQQDQQDAVGAGADGTGSGGAGVGDGHGGFRASGPGSLVRPAAGSDARSRALPGRRVRRARSDGTNRPGATRRRRPGPTSRDDVVVVQRDVLSCSRTSASSASRSPTGRSGLPASPGRAASCCSRASASGTSCRRRRGVAGSRDGGRVEQRLLLGAVGVGHVARGAGLGHVVLPVCGAVAVHPAARPAAPGSPGYRDGDDHGDRSAPAGTIGAMEAVPGITSSRRCGSHRARPGPQRRRC